MGMLLLGHFAVAQETGLHEAAKEILQQCTCRYQRQQLVKDQLVKHPILLASILCDCGELDVSMAVACKSENKKRPTPKECALDNSISLSSSETAWLVDHFEKVKIKEENADGMGTVR